MVRNISVQDNLDSDSVFSVSSQKDNSAIFQCDGNVTIQSSVPDEQNAIPTIVTSRSEVPSYGYKQVCYQKENLKTIKRSNKILEASTLPVVLNLNPRSLYQKLDEFETLIEQTNTGVCCISETWDRSHVPGGAMLSDLINIEGYQLVQNVVQRKKKGGKPAILVNKNMFHVKELSPDVVSVPVNIEAAWVLLTPKSSFSSSKFKKIVVASLYYTSSTKRSEFLDHISETYSLLCAKYGPNIGFLLAGDFNRLKIGPILNLSPDLKQVVCSVTRRNPDATLDLIITNMHSFYHQPFTMEPLDNDVEGLGKPSDHLIVVMQPLSSANPVQSKKYKTVTFRPYPDSGIREMGKWIQSQSWNEVYSLQSAHDKAEKFESMLNEKINLYFPEKTIKVNENDKPWMNVELINLDRKRKREYVKHKKSNKWKKLDKIFTEKSEEQKVSYYENMVEDLKTSNPGQWYSKIKRMSQLDPTKSNDIDVEELQNLPHPAQAEAIADSFAKIANLYDPLKTEDIEIPSDDRSLPLFEAHEVWMKIKSMKKKKSTVKGDIPWKIICEYSVELSSPLCNIYNTGTLNGEWPDIWKYEYVTLHPRCTLLQPQTTSEKYQEQRTSQRYMKV